MAAKEKTAFFCQMEAKPMPFGEIILKKIIFFLRKRNFPIFGAVKYNV
ncbi:MAG: hypothetical protein Q4A15_13195 [Prevotellaceae bacterium]|nr:hypothetical protein [Prevotellaceae bacterium]